MPLSLPPMCMYVEKIFLPSPVEQYLNEVNRGHTQTHQLRSIHLEMRFVEQGTRSPKYAHTRMKKKVFYVKILFY